MSKIKKLGFENCIRRLLTLALVMSLVLNMNIIKPKAADVSVSIALSSSSVSVGSGVTATISVSGGSISAYTMYVSYNASVLQYNSGSGATINGGGGTVVVSGTSSGSVSLSFSAIANGSSSISTSGSDFLNIDGNALSVSHAGVTVTVATNQSNTTNTTNTNNSNTNTSSNDSTSTTETTEEDDRSDNCNLASLQVSPGTLEPAFSSGTTSYSVQVDEDVTSMVVSAVPEDEKATTQVWGAGLIEPGENTVKITVTAENGSVKVYNIRVLAGEDKGEANVTIDDEFYKFADNQSVDDIPDGFTDTTITYKDWEVLAFKSPNKKLTIVCLISVEEELRWFIYDEENDEFTPYQEFSSKYNRYIILDIPEDSEYLEEFELTDLKIDSIEVQALSSDILNDSNLFLVYAMNIEGDEAYYLYDKTEGTFMRYVAPAVEEEVEATPTDTATAGDAADVNPVEPKKDNTLLYALIAAGALAFIFLILFIVFLSKYSKEKNKACTAEAMVDGLSDKEGDNAEPRSSSTFDLEKLQNADSDKPAEQGRIELPRGKKMTSFVDAVNSEEPIRFSENPEGSSEGEKPLDDGVDEIPSVDLGFGDSLEIGYKPDEKEKNFEQYADASEKINSKIMEGYDVASDSAFEDKVLASDEIPADKIDDTDN